KLRRDPRATYFPYTTLFRSEKPARIRIEQVQAALDERVLLEDLVFGLGKSDAAVVDEGDVVGHLLQIGRDVGRKEDRLLFILNRSEEHTSELQSRENLVYRL